MSRKTEIEIEFSETIAYASLDEKFEAFCVGCNAPVQMATPQVAAILRRVGERQIYRLIDSGSIHFVEGDRVLICLRSLDETLCSLDNGFRETDEAGAL